MSSNYAPNQCPVPNGILLVIGGKEDKDEESDRDKKNMKKRLEILECFRDLIKKEDPRVEVVTTASGEGDESFNDYKKVFSKLNIKNLGHIRHTQRKEVLADDLEERVSTADAIFFTGGDQLLLTSLYGGSAFLTHLKDRYINERLVVAGTSAGAMAMSTPMIYAGNKKVQQTAGELKITTGLEFLKDVCIDTHFIDRSRFVRMAQVVATNPSCIGIGIEEDTAIIVTDGSKAEVVGTGLVTIIEGFGIERTNVEDFLKDEPLNILNLKVHLLGRGTKYDIPFMNPPHQ